ncbi:hypothetical protein [Nonlabens antarcticus]|uniref:hypothetical protein n=1 Tax=Nonlabens antarcticus TaxID=392714 RepID=UPI001891D43F|nr:hypothetical protein [Nonlabens antarcticus]
MYGNAGPPTYFVECTFGGSGFNGGNRGPGGNSGNGTGDTGSGTSTSGGGSYGDTGPGTGPNTGDAESDTLDKLEKRNREIRERALKEKIEEDSFLLLDVPCDEIPKWQPLAQHEVSTELVNKIDGLFQNDNDWAINSLENAGGAIVNMDYFAVNITKMPPLSSGSPLLHSPKSLLRLIRSQLNNLSDEASFDPYCFSGQSMCDQETALWNSFFPLGAILSLDLAIDDGSVMVTKFDSNSWYFTTLEDPKYGDHPVAGTRQFGFEQQADGSYDFFVRGVDRIDSRGLEIIASGFGVRDPFRDADATWINFQENLQNYLNDLVEGSASIVVPTTWRPDWDDVQEVLNGNKPISYLDGCD